MHARTALLKCLNRTEVSLWQSRGHIKDKYGKNRLKGTIWMKATHLSGCCTYPLRCNNRPLRCSSKLSGRDSLLTVYLGASVIDGALNPSCGHSDGSSDHTCEAYPAPLFGKEPAATGGSWNKSSNDSAGFSYQPQIWNSEHRCWSFRLWDNLGHW